MAEDFLNIIKEIRGTPDSVGNITDGIYYELTEKDHSQGGPGEVPGADEGILGAIYEQKAQIDTLKTETEIMVPTARIDKSAFFVIYSSPPPLSRRSL